MKKFFSLMVLLLLFFIINGYANDLPDNGKSKENPSFEAQSKGGIFAGLVYLFKNIISQNEGVVTSTFKTTWVDGETDRYDFIDINIESRLGKVSTYDKGDMLFFPIELKVRTNLNTQGNLRISPKDLRIGIFRHLWHDLGFSLQAFSYVMKKNDFGFGTFHGGELMGITLNEFYDIGDSKNGDIELVIKLTGNVALGTLIDSKQGQQVKDRTKSMGIPMYGLDDELFGANLSSSGSIGIRVEEFFLAEFFGGIDYFYNENDKKQKGQTVTSFEDIIVHGHYGAGVRYFPLKWFNVGISGQKDIYQVGSSFNDDKLTKPINYFKSLDAKSGMMTFELRW